MGRGRRRQRQRRGCSRVSVPQRIRCVAAQLLAPRTPAQAAALPTWQKMKVLNTMEEMSFLAVSSLSCQSLYSCMAQGVEGQAS